MTMRRGSLRYFGSRMALLCVMLTVRMAAFARMGGAGGHGSHSSGSHSGSSGWGHGSGYSGGGGSGDLSVGSIIVLIIVAVIVLYFYAKIKKGMGGKSFDAFLQSPPSAPVKPFPEGLDRDKITRSFVAIQDAWQRKDLKEVRKWLSDGMYQRLTAQFKMMQKLDQRNELSGINISDIGVAGVSADGEYRTAEVGITFSMNDVFRSGKYPQFNESFAGDTDKEYWTFIRRNDATDRNLYNDDNCPNCGALFEQKMGEISRCSNCGTLTNSAAYDWVLSEITQEEDYSGGAGLAGDAGLKELMKADPLFAVQRVEDIASNVFMQVMEVLTGDDDRKLGRFADEATTAAIIAQKKSAPPYVFDRLYLSYVTLSSYQAVNGLVQLQFDLAASYRRVSIAGKIQLLDSDFVTRNFGMTLSRKAAAIAKPAAAETVYSYECSSCGAPFTDTTEDRCSYCDALVVDTDLNWVLTGFTWG